MSNKGLSYVREKIRTPDLLVRSQTLYPAELRAHIHFIVSEVLYLSNEIKYSAMYSICQQLFQTFLLFFTRKISFFFC